jgi:hypothetical protein
MAEQIDFDWSPLGRAFWEEAQKTTGASDEQTRFAVGRFRGMSATGAARDAGYAGEGVTLRQAGHRAAKSTKVMELLALASVEGGIDGTVDAKEARQILSRLARGSDPSVRIRALEALAKMDEAARGPIENYNLWRPDRYIVEWLTVFPAPFAPLVAGLMALFPGKIAPGAGNFLVAPLVNALAPYIREMYPDVWKVVREGWKSDPQWLAELERAPLKPISEAVALVEAKNKLDCRSREGGLPIIMLCSGEQLAAYVREIQQEDDGAEVKPGNGHVNAFQ